MNSLQDTTVQIYNRIPPRTRHKRRKRLKRPNNFPKFLLILVLVALSVFYLLNYLPEFDKNEKTATNSHSSLDLGFNFSPRRQNILLMGIDIASNTENPFKGNRSDTILLISIAPYGKNINVVSIPRDSKVYLAGRNKTDKINHAFAFGGAKMAVKTVEDTFGVKINNYVAISNLGVIKLIDTIGGLPIYIEKPMKYDDYTAKLHINLAQGNHVLSGKETEGYLRFRHDSFGDIGRIRRQQWFFNALLARLKDPVVITKLPELLKIMPQYIQTDLAPYDLAKYLGMVKNIDSSTIQIATIPGSPSTKGVISYWIVDPEKTQDLINKMVYRNKTEVDPKNLSIGILYSNKKTDTALNLKNELEAYGVGEIKMQQSNATLKDYIAIHNLDVAGEAVIELKKVLPEIKDRHTIYDPVGTNRTGKDLTIVIAGS